MKIDIINHYTGSTLYSYSVVGNTIAITLIAAVAAGADLYGADLYGADLRSADLYGADLRSANLYGADLRSADLYGADLRSADLYGADLRSANLYGADLRSANLRSANLRSANLRSANLRSANLRSANLYGANLYGANLYGANLYGANLRDADGSELAIAQTRIIGEGDIIGYKKCRNGVVVRLLIPADAKRSHAFGRKCRAEYVKVLEILGSDVGVSLHDGVTEYRVGEIVRPNGFDENWMNECAPGIHFFITRIEAENYGG